jgi:hypothetical protein
MLSCIFVDEFGNHDFVGFFVGIFVTFDTIGLNVLLGLGDDVSSPDCTVD